MREETPPQPEPDAQMEALKEARGMIPPRPERGWLRAVRTVLGLSQAHVAGKASMTRQAYADLEAAEERGAISLNSLRRAAEAMDSELVYFVVPRGAAADTRSELAEMRGPKHPEASESSTSLQVPDDTELPVELR